MGHDAAFPSVSRAGVPASGAGLGDLKSNAVVCERSVGAARLIDPVIFPDNDGAHRNKSPVNSERFTRQSSQVASQRAGVNRRSSTCLRGPNALVFMSMSVVVFARPSEAMVVSPVTSPARAQTSSRSVSARRP